MIDAFHQMVYRNGEHLQLFLMDIDFISWRIIFRKKGKLWTHLHQNGAKSQLDYIIVDKKWATSAKNCEAYYTLQGVHSDHRIVTSKIQVRLRANKKKEASKTPYDWSQLVNNPDVCKHYTLAVRNRFQALQEEGNTISLNNVYINFVKYHQETAERSVPPMPILKLKIPWENEEITEKREAPNEISIRRKENRQGLTPTYQTVQQKYIGSGQNIECLRERTIINAMANSQRR